MIRAKTMSATKAGARREGRLVREVHVFSTEEKFLVGVFYQ